MNGCGNTSSDPSATATVSALKKIVRPAVIIVRRNASRSLPANGFSSGCSIPECVAP